MKQKLDCELSKRQRYWRKFRKYHKNDMIGHFQKWLREKQIKPKSLEGGVKNEEKTKQTT